MIIIYIYITTRKTRIIYGLLHTDQNSYVKSTLHTDFISYVNRYYIRIFSCMLQFAFNIIKRFRFESYPLKITSNINNNKKRHK